MNLNTIPTHAIDLDMIKTKPGNRDSLDKVKLQELADSMKQHGLIQPILVRADPTEADVYHLVAGERRVKAAELIGWETIPGRVIAGKIADEELNELRLVENLQRVDLTPWEEASQLADLRALHPDDRIEDLADRLGKSPTWAAQRLAIGKLCPELRKMVEEQDWPLGHIVELARLPLSIQPGMAEVIEQEAENDFNYKWSEMTEKGCGRKAPSLSTLCDLLKSTQYLLSSAPWKIDDAKMLPEAGSCKDCSKRFMTQRLLFPEVKDAKKDRCLDASCWERKKAALVELELGKLKAKKVEPILLKDNRDVEPAIQAKLGDAKALNTHEVIECKKTEKGAKLALFVSGEAFGKTVYVKERPRQNDTMPSRREVDQTTGKVKPKSDKERLQDLLWKRLCFAVEDWSTKLDTFVPGSMLELVSVFGTYRRKCHRSEQDWSAFADACKSPSDTTEQTIWNDMILVFRERLKRYGPMESQALGLWLEALGQAEATENKPLLMQCWKFAVAEVKFPRSLTQAGVADPQAAWDMPQLDPKAKKAKGAA